MRNAFTKGFALLLLSHLGFGISAQAALPPHVAAQIEYAAREIRDLDRRDAALARNLNDRLLADVVARKAGPHAAATMSAVVIGAISENPALTAEIVAVAVAAAPALRDSIARDAAKAFPGFTATIFAAAGGAPPPLYVQAQAPVTFPAAVPAAAPSPPVVGAAALTEPIMDPFEGVNRAIFAFNDTADRFFLRPLALAYEFIMPDFALRSVRNFFQNLKSPVVFANDVLQLEVDDAAVTAGRFFVNSTAGVLGLFEVAEGFGLRYHPADFGQTMYSYGAGPGSYVVVPVLGPSTARDSLGRGVDILFNPLTYLLATLQNLGVAATQGVVRRESLITTLDSLRASSVDYYAALRSSYYQDRAVTLRKGQPADTSTLDTLFESAK